MIVSCYLEIRHTLMSSTPKGNYLTRKLNLTGDGMMGD